MDIIIPIVAIACLVWGTVLLRRGGLMAGCCAVVLAGVCFGREFFHYNVGPLPLTADRLLLALLAGAYVVYRRFGWSDPKPIGKEDCVLAGFFGVLALSTLTHDWRFDSFQPLATLLFFFVAPLVLFWIVRQTAMTKQTVLLAFGFLTLLGCYLSVTALAEVTEQWSLVFPKYIANSQNQEFLGRARGPLLNPIGDGLFLTAGMLAALLAAPLLPRYYRLGAAGLAILFLAALGATLTRSVWLGAAASLFVVAGLTLPLRWRAAMFVTVSVGGILLVGAKMDKLSSFKRDKNVTQEQMASSVSLRPVLAKVAWRMFSDRPLLGCGFGQYDSEHIYYLSTSPEEKINLERGRNFVQHNTFLSLLAQTGLLGMGSFLLLLAMWGKSAWRLWRSESSPLWARLPGLLFLAFLAAYIPNAMFHELSIIPMVNMLLFFLAGVISALSPWAKPVHVAVAQPRERNTKRFSPA